MALPKNILGRYEYTHGSSNKFWELREDGFGYVAVWGRIGTAGNTTPYTEAEAYKKVTEKIAKGYERVGAPRRVTTARSEATARVAKKRATRATEAHAAKSFLDQLKGIK